MPDKKSEFPTFKYQKHLFLCVGNSTFFLKCFERWEQFYELKKKTSPTHVFVITWFSLYV